MIYNPILTGDYRYACVYIFYLYEHICNFVCYVKRRERKLSNFKQDHMSFFCKGRQRSTVR